MSFLKAIGCIICMALVAGLVTFAIDTFGPEFGYEPPVVQSFLVTFIGILTTQLANMYRRIQLMEDGIEELAVIASSRTS